MRTLRSSKGWEERVGRQMKKYVRGATHKKERIWVRNTAKGGVGLR